MRDARRGRGSAPKGAGDSSWADWPDSPVRARRKARARRSPFGAGVGEIGRPGRLAGFPCSCALRGRSPLSAPKGAGLSRSSGQIGAGQLPLGELRVAPRWARCSPFGAGVGEAARSGRLAGFPCSCALRGRGEPSAPKGAGSFGLAWPVFSTKRLRDARRDATSAPKGAGRSAGGLADFLHEAPARRDAGRNVSP